MLLVRDRRAEVHGRRLKFMIGGLEIKENCYARRTEFMTGGLEYMKKDLVHVRRTSTCEEN